jgi:multiple sugar transport system permease protein/alpha-1,4-digalacturonate transport system permease protein
MVLFLVFMIIPIFWSGWISLLKWSGLGQPEFIGLENYFYLFKNGVFLKSFGNTLLFTFVNVPVGMALSLLFAMMLNQPIKMRGVFRTCLYLPSVISSIAVGMVFIWIFDSQLGLINYLVRMAGGTTIEWIRDPRFARLMVIITSLWGRIGYNMVIYLAALQGIPVEYFEAARIDGSSGLQAFRHITLPLLRPTHMFIMITSMINSFRAFDLIYIMTAGGPDNATKTLVVYIYDIAFRSNYFGRAAAGGMILFIILLVFTIIRIKTERSVD